MASFPALTHQVLTPDSVQIQRETNIYTSTPENFSSHSHGSGADPSEQLRRSDDISTNIYVSRDSLLPGAATSSEQQQSQWVENTYEQLSATNLSRVTEDFELTSATNNNEVKVELRYCFHDVCDIVQKSSCSANDRVKMVILGVMLAITLFVCTVVITTLNVTDFVYMARSSSSCTSSPCQHNAACIDMPDGDYRCQCLAATTGKHCQTSIILPFVTCADDNQWVFADGKQVAAYMGSSYYQIITGYVPPETRVLAVEVRNKHGDAGWRIAFPTDGMNSSLWTWIPSSGSGAPLQWKCSATYQRDSKWMTSDFNDTSWAVPTQKFFSNGCTGYHLMGSTPWLWTDSTYISLPDKTIYCRLTFG